MNNLITTELPMEAYLSHKGISSSQLKLMLQSPADFAEYAYVKAPQSAARDLGTAIHTAILEPHLFDETVALQPEDWGPLNKKPGSDNWRQFKKENEGKLIIKYEDALKVEKVRNIVAESEFFQDMLANGDAEVTAFCDFEGVEFKARADFVTNDGDKWDVKTTSDPLDIESLAKTVFKYGYHFQSAHHRWVFERAGAEMGKEGWIFVSTSTAAIHVVPRLCSEELLHAGQADHQYALGLFLKCRESDIWPGYPMELLEITLPHFAKRMYDE